MTTPGRSAARRRRRRRTARRRKTSSRAHRRGSRTSRARRRASSAPARTRRVGSVRHRRTGHERRDHDQPVCSGGRFEERLADEHQRLREQRRGAPDRFCGRGDRERSAIPWRPAGRAGAATANDAHGPDANERRHQWERRRQAVERRQDHHELSRLARRHLRKPGDAFRAPCPTEASTVRATTGRAAGRPPPPGPPAARVRAAPCGSRRGTARSAIVWRARGGTIHSQ